jgi:hypothetical protein
MRINIFDAPGHFSIRASAWLMLVAALGSPACGGGGGTGGGGTSGAGAGVTNTLKPVCSSSGGLECACSVSGSQASGTCSLATIGNLGYCCAGAGYPEDGICTCTVWACAEGPGGCNCGTGEKGTATNCSATYSLCCANGTSSCYCSNILTSCNTDEQQVATCDAALVPCDTGTSRTTQCSL